MLMIVSQYSPLYMQAAPPPLFSTTEPSVHSSMSKNPRIINVFKVPSNFTFGRSEALISLSRRCVLNLALVKLEVCQGGIEDIELPFLSR